MRSDGKSWWSGRRVLVTGHTGFKGAWLIGLLERLGARVAGLALPPEPGGIFDALAGAWAVDSHIVDIRNGADVRSVVAETEPDIVFHLAAQALVLRGLEDPLSTYETNVLGTAHVLAAAASSPTVSAVVVVTSDKVYDNDGSGVPFKESDRLGGRDPYSSSKACAELVVQAWRSSLLPAGRPAVGVARAGNVIGGGDVAADRLLPDTFRALTTRSVLRLRQPEASRPWQFVLDPLAGYLAYGERLARRPDSVPPSLNFGPPADRCVTVRAIVDMVFENWGSGRWAPGDGALLESNALSLDSSQAFAVLGWTPRVDLATAVRWTCEWVRCQQETGQLSELFARQFSAFEACSA